MSRATRTIEREEGMAATRKWRDDHRDTVFGIPPRPKPTCCASCGQVIR